MRDLHSRLQGVVGMSLGAHVDSSDLAVEGSTGPAEGRCSHRHPTPSKGTENPLKCLGFALDKGLARTTKWRVDESGAAHSSQNNRFRASGVKCVPNGSI